MKIKKKSVETKTKKQWEEPKLISLTHELAKGWDCEDGSTAYSMGCGVGLDAAGT